MRSVDADKLKQTFAEYGEKAKFTQGACQQLIDNAQTIEEKSYAMGYQDGLEDGLQDIRPQGEWVKDGIGSYRCSLCGRVICTSISNDKPYEDYPFCHCGASMWKEGTE